MIRIVLGVAFAAAGLAACTYYEPQPTVALVPATTTVTTPSVVVPAPYTATTVIERQQGIRVY